MTLLDRLMEYIVAVPPSTCWVWTGAVAHRKHPTRNPVIKRDGRVVPARRVMYELEIGELPDDSGVRLVTSCGNGLCMNPGHFDLLVGGGIGAASRAVSQLRSATRTMFNCGHPRTPENTRARYDVRSCGCCRICQNARNARARRRNRALRRNALGKGRRADP